MILVEFFLSCLLILKSPGTLSLMWPPSPWPSPILTPLHSGFFSLHSQDCVHFWKLLKGFCFVQMKVHKHVKKVRMAIEKAKHKPESGLQWGSSVCKWDMRSCWTETTEVIPPRPLPTPETFLSFLPSSAWKGCERGVVRMWWWLRTRLSASYMLAAILGTFHALMPLTLLTYSSRASLFLLIK